MHGTLRLRTLLVPKMRLIWCRHVVSSLRHHVLVWVPK